MVTVRLKDTGYRLNRGESRTLLSLAITVRLFWNSYRLTFHGCYLALTVPQINCGHQYDAGETVEARCGGSSAMCFCFWMEKKKAGSAR